MMVWNSVPRIIIIIIIILRRMLFAKHLFPVHVCAGVFWKTISPHSLDSPSRRRTTWTGPRLKASDDTRSEDTTARADGCGRVGSEEVWGVNGKSYAVIDEPDEKEEEEKDDLWRCNSNNCPETQVQMCTFAVM